MNTENKSGSAHDTAVSGMFSGIARFYDLLNHVLSLGIDLYWRRELAGSVKVGATNLVLDLASGTLDVALAIRKQHPDVIIPAMDFCAPMLQLGLKKLHAHKSTTIFPVVADAKKLPLPDACCDCITIAFGIRNILPREAALAEMLRVLVPGGKICILEFGSGQERIFGGLYNLYLRYLLPNIARLFCKDKSAYTYLARTIYGFPSARAFEDELKAAGFIKTGFRKMTGGIVCLHCGEKPNC